MRPGHIAAADVPPWLMGYMCATHQQPRGLLLHPKFTGKTFADAALEAAALGVVLIAVQSRETGQLILNPSAQTLAPETVAFALDDGDDDYFAIADPRTEAEGDAVWLDILRRVRRETAAKAAEENESPLSPSEKRGPSDRTVAVVEQTEKGDDGPAKQGATSAIPIIGALQTALTAGRGDAAAARYEMIESSARGGAPSQVAPEPEDANAAGGPEPASLKSLAFKPGGAKPEDAKSRGGGSTIFEHREPAEHHYTDVSEVIDAGQHVVIALLGDFLWPQLQSLVATFRARSEAPIIVVGDVAPHKSLFDADGRAIVLADLFFIGDSPSRVSVLEAVGVPRAAAFVALGIIAADGSDELMIDLRHDLLASTVEAQLARWGRAKDLPLVYDFFSSNNLEQLPRRTNYEGEHMLEAFDVRTNLRYVAAEVIPRNEVLGSYAVAYTTPGALELIASLGEPGASNQKVQVLAVELKEVGQRYTDVCTLVIDRGAAPLGVVRAPTPEDMDQGPVACALSLSPLDQALVRAGDRVVLIATPGWPVANADILVPPAAIALDTGVAERRIDPVFEEHEVVVETPAEAPAADPSLSLFTAATPYKDVTLELSQNNDDFHDTGDDVTEAKLSALDAALRLP